jgi:hypothetical protein
MLDLRLQVPVTDEVEVSPETLAATDRGIADADNGRTVSIEEVRKLNSRVDFRIGIAEAALADTAIR